MEDFLTFFGDLPVHPLVVHFAIVLVPLAAILFIVSALLPKGGSRMLGLSSIAYVVALPFVFLAEQSGEALTEVYTNPTDHIANSELVLPITAGATAASIVAWVAVKYSLPSIVTALLKLVGIAAAVAAIWITVLAGHSGAEATWGGRVAAESSEAEIVEETESAPVEEEVVEPEAPASTVALTAEEVALRNTIEECWVIIDGNVYDLTSFASAHPGGQSRIENICGTDATSAFQGQHAGAPAPASALEPLLLGPVE